MEAAEMLRFLTSDCILSSWPWHLTVVKGVENGVSLAVSHNDDHIFSPSNLTLHLNIRHRYVNDSYNYHINIKVNWNEWHRTHLQRAQLSSPVSWKRVEKARSFYYWQGRDKIADIEGRLSKLMNSERVATSRNFV